MNRDQFLGRLGKVKARMKECAGRLVRYDALIAQAKLDFIASRSQTEFGDAKAAVEKRYLLRRRGRLGHAR